MAKKRGFTIVELLVVICIIAILMALLLPALSRALCRGREARTRALINAIENACEQYNRDFALYPLDNAGSGSKNLVAALLSPGPRGMPYIEDNPKYFDPPVTGATPKDFANSVFGGVGDPLKDWIHYRRNTGAQGNTPPPPSQTPTVAINGGRYDLWACGCKRGTADQLSYVANFR